jgi:DNA repair exonuclease SbcCD nuclease subunit
MKRPFDKLREIQNSHSQIPPIFCAGDVFDRYNPPPELINFAIEAMPMMFSIPGQHDLPQHRYSGICQSAYWTLVEAGKLVDLVAEESRSFKGFDLYPFPWGYDPADFDPSLDAETDKKRIALVHKYIWKKGSSYPNAPGSSHVQTCFRRWGKNFDLVVSGDNHKPFTYFREKKARMINCGSLMRRAIDQIDHSPWAYVLFSDWLIEIKTLNDPKDVMLTREEVKQVDTSALSELDMVQIMKELQELGDDDSLKYQEIVDRMVDRLEPHKMVREIIARLFDISR